MELDKVIDYLETAISDTSRLLNDPYDEEDQSILFEARKAYTNVLCFVKNNLIAKRKLQRLQPNTSYLYNNELWHISIEMIAERKRKTASMKKHKDPSCNWSHVAHRLTIRQNGHVDWVCSNRNGKVFEILFYDADENPHGPIGIWITMQG